MITLKQLATVLRDRIARSRLTQEALSIEAGVSRQTLSKVLSGRADLKVTTLFALADRLGMEVMLIPREIAPGMASADEPEPRIKSVVESAMESIGATRRRDQTHPQSD
jgi:transcriptional regulator with XRE-family HTH domain